MCYNPLMAKKFNLLEELEIKERKAHLMDEISDLIPQETISLKLQNPEQLFNQFDPSPLENRSLSREVEDYLLDQLEELPVASRITVELLIASVTEEEKQKIQAAFENHFKIRAKEQLQKNKKESRKWRVNLLIGLICMAVCLVAAHILGLPKFEDLPLTNAVSESLGILGWVAIWEPAEFFLFGWRENTNNLQQYMRLHKSQVKITSTFKAE